MAVRLTTWLAALLIALAAPAAALAQGAGDDQYIDPFGSGQNDDSGDQQPEPEPAVPEAEPAPAAPEPEAAPAQQPPEPQQQLPYTGADEGLVALAGAMLMAGGLALRLISGRAPRR